MKCLEKKLDRNYTRMLYAVLNKSWKQLLDGHLPLISQTIQVRWVRHVCEVKTNIGNILLWTPTHGHVSVGRPANTYIHQLYTNAGCCLKDFPRVMIDEDGWQEIVVESFISMPWQWWSWFESSFLFPRLVTIPRLKNPVCFTISMAGRKQVDSCL